MFCKFWCKRQNIVKFIEKCDSGYYLTESDKSKQTYLIYSVCLLRGISPSLNKQRVDIFLCLSWYVNVLTKFSRIYTRKNKFHSFSQPPAPSRNY